VRLAICRRLAVIFQPEIAAEAQIVVGEGAAFFIGEDEDAGKLRIMPVRTGGYSVRRVSGKSQQEGEAAPTLQAHPQSETSQRQTGIRDGMTVRRLTPREAERLQGLPDDFTLIPYRGKPAADGPRYKAIGNSMAIPVMRWIGRRIAAVNAILATMGVRR
jgi:DNA (cytosine-5)-methyltransferase 1